jgi:hypothetical protein
MHALREVLCPAPGLLTLLKAALNGDLTRKLADAPRKRRPQTANLDEIMENMSLG